MTKKKALICTGMLFLIILSTIIVSTKIISPCGFSLYDIFSPFIYFWWILDCAEKFYKWLIKESYTK